MRELLLVKNASIWQWDFNHNGFNGKITGAFTQSKEWLLLIDKSGSICNLFDGENSLTSYYIVLCCLQNNDRHLKFPEI